MKLHTDPATALNTITAYGDGYIEVNQIRFSHALAFAPEGVVVPWPVLAPTEISAALLLQAAGLMGPISNPSNFLGAPTSAATGITHAPEVLLIGTGKQQHFLPSEVLQPLRSAGIGVEVMDTLAAARTYNILMSEGRRVIIALIPT